ncbi:MAG TPA: EF-hand domain-containing protein [Polyangiaceae bacterium]|nr:EF-hand domain-containing protein [Polyangiaceae bacterium]
MSKEQDELVQKVQALLRQRYGDEGPESMRKLFDAYDRDGDGRVGGDELEQLLKDAGVGNGLTRGMWVKGIIKELDQNRDQTIDWAEFSKAIA